MASRVSADKCKLQQGRQTRKICLVKRDMNLGYKHHKDIVQLTMNIDRIPNIRFSNIIA